MMVSRGLKGLRNFSSNTTVPMKSLKQHFENQTKKSLYLNVDGDVLKCLCVAMDYFKTVAYSF